MSATPAPPATFVRRRANPLVAIPEILRVTFRQLLGRRRTALLLLLCAVPVLLAALYFVTGETDTKRVVDSLYTTLMVTVLLPIVAVLVGTIALGAEIEDGTIVYLVAKPVARWQIVLAKLLGASIFCALLAGVSTALVGLIALSGMPGGMDAMIGFLVATVVGSFCYCSLFIAVSLFTRRTLVFGFAYIFIWEAGITTLMQGLINLSIRRYMLGIAEGFYSPAGGLLPGEAHLSPETAYTLAAILIVICCAVSIWRLSRFQLPGSSD